MTLNNPVARGHGLTGGVMLLRSLRSHGVKQVFGVMGREAAAILFDEIEGIDFVLTRHEFTAGVIASVLGRLTGTPQVCFTTLGPGATNLVTALATACLDRYPLVAISAQAETHDSIYNQTHQCVDQCSIVAPLTKYAVEVLRASDIAGAVDKAFAAALEEPQGPAFLSIPIDVFQSAVDEPAESLAPPHSSTPAIIGPAAREGSDMDRVAVMIEESKKPLLVVGNAAVRAGFAPDVRSFAERLCIPVVTSYVAKGVLPPGHPLDFGAISPYMDGILDTSALDAIFGPVDLLITIGFDYAEDLRPPLWVRGRSKKVIRLASIRNLSHPLFEPDVDVVQPFTHLFAGLSERLDRSPPKTPHDVTRIRSRAHSLLSIPHQQGEPLHPLQVIRIINEHAPNGILVSDIGLFRHYAVLFGAAAGPHRFITSAGCSSFGFGLPAGIAARLAFPGEKVTVIAGDGGFHSGSHDLETAVRLRLGFAIVVLNNSSNGLIELYQQLGHGRSHPPSVSFGTVDFTALAHANGCRGVRVESAEDLGLALGDAWSSDRPLLIEVPVSYSLKAGSGFDALRI